MKSPVARRIVLALKTIVSVGLIAFLIASVEWGRIDDVLGRVNLPLLGIAFVVFTIQLPLSAYKWQRALRAHELDYGFGFLLRILSIGFFLNNFLPTSIGGDGYRVLRTVPSSGSRTRALSAVVLERAVGFAVLLAVGFLGALAILRRDPSPLLVYFVSLVGTGFALVIVLVAAHRFGALEWLWGLVTRTQKLRALTESAGLIARSRRWVADLVGWSIVFQILAVFAIHALFAAVGEPVDVATCAVVGAVSVLVAVLPISINGIGVAEGSFVAAAVELGVDLQQAVVVAFLTRILILPLSIVCGLVYLWEIRSTGTRRPDQDAGDGSPSD